VNPTEKQLIAASSLFDAGWYAERYPDVALVGLPPFEHYLQIGALLQRDPHPVFNSEYYSQQQETIAKSHLFSAAWYTRQYADVRASGLTPIQHYVRFGALLQRDPSPLFSTSYYRQQIPDDDSAHRNPLMHYLVHGWQNGLRPNPDFDPREYLKRHPDVAAAGVEPFGHYISHGGRESLEIDFDGFPTKSPSLLRRVVTAKNKIFRFFSLAVRVHRSGVFDGAWYLRQNPSLVGTKWPAIYHYIKRGCVEDPCRNFCAQEYLHMNPDVARARIPAILHYERYGKATGRLTSLLQTGREPAFPPEATEYTAILGSYPIKHRRGAVFASYSGDGTIHPYVVHYLEGLRKICDNIVFVTDSPLYPQEQRKLQGLVSCMIVSRHGEYDFGSYKRGWDWLRAHDGLRDVDELIFCNDSCYGPFRPLRDAFGSMARSKPDFWGMTAFHMGGKRPGQTRYHLQSFFLVFQANVFTSNVFHTFMQQIRKLPEPVRENVIATFEFSLTERLEDAGFRWDSLVPRTFSRDHGASPFYFGGLIMEKYGMPLLKSKSFPGVRHAEPPEDALRVAKQLDAVLHDLVAPEYKKRVKQAEQSRGNTDRVHIDFEKHQAEFPAKVDRIRARVAADLPVRATFLVGSPSMFPSLPLFEVMRSDPMFSARILVIPGSALVMDDIDTRVEALRALLPAADIAAARSDNEDFPWTDVSRDSDIVVYNSPYSSSHIFYSPRFSYGRDFLPIHVNYGYYRSVYDRNVLQMDNYAYFWKALFENQDVAEEYRTHSIIGGKNALLTGYVKMDKLAGKAKQGREGRLCLMIAPHHSVEGGANNVLGLANFERYSDFFLTLPSRYPQIDFIFRPHPALFRMLALPRHWGEERVTAWCDRFVANPNVRWSDGADYLQDFADSDGIIQDCGSFLVEYLYTDKPCCYMLHSPTDINTKFTPFGQDCLKHCYTAYKEEDIERFITHVIMGQQDTLATKRHRFAQERVRINYPHAAATTMNFLRTTFN
jgi:hypothetical protein